MSLQATLARMVLKLPAGLLVKMGGGQPVVIGDRTMDPHLQFIAHSGRKNPKLYELEPEIAQAATIEALAMLAAPPEPGVSIDDSKIPGPDGNQIPIRTYRPAQQDPAAPLMVYYHMGGGVVGDLDTCNAWCSMMASVAGCPVVSVDYRLAPQHKFPAGLNDCIAAYEWGLRNAESLGAPAGVAAIGGDSMGGNFSAIIAQEMKRQGKPAPALQFLIYPAVDIPTDFPSRHAHGETFTLATKTMDWFMDQYLPEGHDKKDLLLSPGQAMDLSGLPPAIVVTAGFDPLVDEGDDYAKRLAADGVEVMHKRYDSMAHGFTAFTRASPAADAACREMAGMLKTMYSKLSPARSDAA